MDKRKDLIQTRAAMKYFKYETHLHTKEASACAVSTGAELVRAYYAAGYSGMIVTDHFLNGNTAIPGNLPWSERIELFCKGYENALEEAKHINFHVFFGWEYADNGMEFLTYGLDKNFLLSYPDMLSWSIEKYLAFVRSQGGFVSQAHPFRKASYISAIRLYPEHVDAAEVCNTSHINPRYDELALEYAKKHSLLQTSGSDTHFAGNLTGGGMEFEGQITSIQEFIQAVREGSCFICRGSV